MCSSSKETKIGSFANAGGPMPCWLSTPLSYNPQTLPSHTHTTTRPPTLYTTPFYLLHFTLTVPTKHTILHASLENYLLVHKHAAP